MIDADFVLTYNQSLKSLQKKLRHCCFKKHSLLIVSTITLYIGFLGILGLFSIKSRFIAFIFFIALAGLFFLKYIYLEILKNKQLDSDFYNKFLVKLTAKERQILKYFIETEKTINSHTIFSYYQIYYLNKNQSMYVLERQVVSYFETHLDLLTIKKEKEDLVAVAKSDVKIMNKLKLL